MGEELFRNIRLLISDEYNTQAWQLITEVINTVINDEVKGNGKKILGMLLLAWFSLLEGTRYAVDD